MSDKLRSVNTRFWNDPFVEDLTPSEKLLFLYLLTNPQANLLGIYEITIKRICYDTGLTKETVTNGLKRFETSRKAYFINCNYMILPNWLKNQRLNRNMKVAVSKEFNSLPNELKNNILRNGYNTVSNDSESFEMVMECLDKYEIEIEDEIEDEDEGKKIEFSLFWDLYHSITALKKTDNDATLKYWKKLSLKDQQKAIDNIHPYFDSLNDKKYCKKARTYLADKNFNDEFIAAKPARKEGYDPHYGTEDEGWGVKIEEPARD